MDMLALLVVLLVFGYVGGLIGDLKGRKKLGFILGFLLGGIGILIICFMPKKKVFEFTYDPEDFKKDRTCPHCGAQTSAHSACKYCNK